MSNPLEQFEIKTFIPLKLSEYDISFSNSALAMVICTVSIVTLFSFFLRKRSIVPNLLQSIPEAIYEFIYNLVKSSIGKNGLKYFSFRL